MTRSLLSRTFLLGPLAALPLVLGTSCGGSGDGSADADTASGTDTAAARKGADDHPADHDHPEGQDHPEGDDAHDETVDAASAKSDPASVNGGTATDDHASDDHGHDHDHGKAGPPPITVDEEMLESGEGPRLNYEVGREKVEFGRVTQGAVLNHTFDLSVEGNADLVITQVKPTCGCTVAKLMVEDPEGELIEYTFGDPIPPGSRVELPAKMHTKNKRGNQNVRINIFSNDPRRTTQLGMTATIDPFFNISPSFLTFGKISVGEEVTKTSTISTSKGVPMKLELLEHTKPAGANIDLSPKNPDEDGRSRAWELTVTLGPDLPEGNMARQLQLVSDIEIEGQEPKEGQEPERHQANITVSAEVVGPFTYTPAYLSMGLVRPGETKTRSVRIDGHDMAFQLSENLPTVRIVGMPVQGEPENYQDWDLAEHFTASVNPVEGQNSVDVEVRLEGLPEEARGSFGGMLVVELGHPDKPQVPLQITGVCRGAGVK